MTRTHRFSLATVLLLLAALPAFSQVQTGTPPFGSFGGGPDVVNLGDNNVQWVVPVLHKSGRGTDFSFDLVYNTSAWYPVTSGSTTTWTPNQLGWVASTPNGGGYVTHQTASRTCRFFQETQYVYETYYVYYRWTYVDAFGTSHTFIGDTYDPAPDCGPQTTDATMTSNDGSGFQLTASYDIATSLASAKGAVIAFGTSTYTDRNGNYISQSGGVYTDTLGTTALTVTGSGTPSSPYVFSYTPPAGGSASYTMKYITYTVRTNFGCSGISEYGPTSNNLVSEIDLPDGSKYTMTYEPTPGYSGDVTGRLASIALPTGGTISYAYSGGGTGVNGISCVDGGGATLTRTTPDGAWTYARAQVSGSHWQTKVTTPPDPVNQGSVGDDTAIDFQKDSNTTTPTNDFYETQRVVYQGSSSSNVVLQTTYTCYNGTVAPCTTTSVSSPISQVAATVQLDTSGLQSQNVAYYNSFGLPTEFDVFDYGSGAPSSNLIKKTLISYASLGNNINASQQTITVCNGTGTSGGCTGTSGSSTGTVISQTQYNYDETGVTATTGTPQHVAVSGSRGNLTTAKFLVQGTTYLSKTYSYWDTGNVNIATDFAGAQTTYTYGACGNSFATQQRTVSGSLSLTNQMAWDCNGGLLTSTTDTNNQSTGYSYDSLWRVTTITRPDNIQLNYQYPTTSSLTYVVTTPVQGTSAAVSTTAFDGLGRAIRSTTSDNSQNVYAKVDTQYDALGRAYKVSNPYTSSPSYWSTTQVDALGRTTSETQQDGAQTTYSYSGRTTTVTDPAGKQRKYDYDAAGRFFNAWEPDPNNSLTVQTSYTYTALDQISTITEGVQLRSYGYDLMGRLTSVTTPESGQTSWQFNSAGLVSQRTDARGVQTNYVYDGLSRVTGKSYTIPQGSTSAAMPNVCDPTGGTNLTANVCFYYDQGGASAYALGRLTKVVDPSGSEAYTFDQLGRTTQVSKTIGTTTYSTQLQYNLASEGTTRTYPSGRVVQDSYDAIGRLCAIGASGSTCSLGTTFLTGLSYNPAGQLTAATYGNGVVGTFGYSADRLQLSSIAYAQGSTTLLNLSYWYKQDSSNCPSDVAGNNGQIQCITDAVDSGRNLALAYDALYRLISATTSGSTNYPKWGLTWAYDRYGNRLNQTQTYGNPPTNSLSFADPGGAQTNRQDDMCFDANGNLLAETAAPCPSPAYVYDGENRLVDYQTASYTYDYAGMRVIKQSGSTTTAYIYSGSKVIAEYDNGAAVTSPSREYIYAGTGLLAKIEGGVTNYFHNDHLSARVLTDSGGNVLGQRGHYPFGETWYETGTTTKWKFTTYERDSESTNDYALARSFVNRFGRFSSPDPLSGGLDDPQSLNRYAYTQNDPCNQVDPLGLDTCKFNIRLINQAGLTQQQLDAVLQRMNDLLSQTRSPSGDSVQVTTSFKEEFSDVSIFLSNATWFENYVYPNYGGLFGLVFGTENAWNGTAVFVNNLSQVSIATLNTDLGNVALHEFAHNFLGSDQNYDKRNPNMMMFDKAGADAMIALGDPNSNLWKFTPQQIAQMYKDCITKHPPQNPSGKGSGGGAGGGGNGGAGNGGATGPGGPSCTNSVFPPTGEPVTICLYGGGGGDMSICGASGCICIDGDTGAEHPCIGRAQLVRPGDDVEAGRDSYWAALALTRPAPTSWSRWLKNLSHPSQAPANPEQPAEHAHTTSSVQTGPVQSRVPGELRNSRLRPIRIDSTDRRNLNEEMDHRKLVRGLPRRGRLLLAFHRLGLAD